MLQHYYKGDTKWCKNVHKIEGGNTRLCIVGKEQRHRTKILWLRTLFSPQSSLSHVIPQLLMGDR